MQDVRQVEGWRPFWPNSDRQRRFTPTYTR